MLCMSPRNRESWFSSFFPEPSFALRSGTNSYLHLPSWKQPVQQSIFVLSFYSVFRA